MLQGWLERDGAQREPASGPTSPGTEKKGLHGAKMEQRWHCQPLPTHGCKDTGLGLSHKCLGASSPKIQTTSPSSTNGLCPSSPCSLSPLWINPKPPLSPLSPKSHQPVEHVGFLIPEGIPICGKARSHSTNAAIELLIPCLRSCFSLSDFSIIGLL